MPRPTRCPRCGRENDASLAVCLDCGSSLRPAAKSTQPLCAACGSALQEGSRFCAQCGKPAGAPHAAPRTPATPGSGASVRLVPSARRDTDGSGPRSPGPARRATASAAPRTGGGVRLAVVRPDGQPGETFEVTRATIFGRTDGDVRLADDAVSPRHARLTPGSDTVRVEDLGSLNGTFVRIRSPRRLGAGEELRVGRQLLRVAALPRAAGGDTGDARAWGTPDAGARLRLLQLLEGGGLGETFPLRDGENTLGREAGDVTFPADRYVSARHARLDVSGGEVTVADLGSSNGTFVRVAGPVDLAPGDELLIGAQLLRVEHRA